MGTIGITISPSFVRRFDIIHIGVFIVVYSICKTGYATTSGSFPFAGRSLDCADAPRTTKAMHIAINDLGLEHLWIVYPGSVRYPITDRITAMPLVEVNETALGWRIGPQSGP